MRIHSSSPRRAALRVAGALLIAIFALGAGPPRGDDPSAPVPVKRRGSETAVSSPLDDVVRREDPARDGWETEVLNQAAGGRLRQLRELIEDPENIAPDTVSGLVAEGFTCGRLRPDGLRTVFDDGRLSVRRAAPAAGETASSKPGARGLVSALRALTGGFGGDDAIHAEFEIFRVEPADGFFTTHAFYKAGRRSAARAVQQHAIWIARWTYPEPPDAGPRLLRLEVEHYEEVATRAGTAALYEDCTRSALGADPTYVPQVLPGIDHWRARIPRTADMSFTGHHGLALGDVNGDGLEDLYVCDAGGLPNRLYVQNPDGTVSDTSAAAGVDWLADSAAALLVDLDGDGDPDLVVASEPRLRIAENDGTGRFRVRTETHFVSSPASLSAADYDGDGDLDLYACSYYADPDEERSPGPIPYHDANNGGANVLLRNDGGFRFTDATVESGLDENNRRYSFAAAWADYDADGDVDLYVANDFGRNNLYRNDGGKFSDVAREAGVEDVAAGMSVSWGDYDRDGRLDLYVGNMFSNAGNRVTYQRRFHADGSQRTVADLQRMARGNTLFANAGDGTFRDVSEQAAVTTGRWAWSSEFLDVNNDGWLDLVVANGYVTTEDTGDL